MSRKKIKGERNRKRCSVCGRNICYETGSPFCLDHQNGEMKV